MARPGQGSGWGFGLVPQAPRSSGHTGSAPGLSPDTDLWDRGITIKPAVRTTQMVAHNDSHTNTNRHTCSQSQIYLHIYTSLICVLLNRCRNTVAQTVKLNIFTQCYFGRENMKRMKYEKMHMPFVMTVLTTQVLWKELIRYGFLITTKRESQLCSSEFIWIHRMCLVRSVILLSLNHVIVFFFLTLSLYKA